jgi:hypothetical protein
MSLRVALSRSVVSRRIFSLVGLVGALAITSACGSDVESDIDTGAGGGGGSGGSGGGSTGTGGTGAKGGSGGTASTGGGGSKGADASAGSGGAGGADGGLRDGGTLSAYEFPFNLTPLTSASTITSDISLYFSVTDANGVGVAGLPTTVKVPADPNDPFGWIYREDGVDLDPKESGFTVTPVQGNTLDMPTVLVLDLSGSIVTPTGDSGRTLLQIMKETAKTIIRSMLPEQRMAIVTFATSATVRLTFTGKEQEKLLLDTVDAIDSGDGQSTNLYGAMTQAFGMWQDGFATVGGTKLTAGLAVVLTDGKDNAGLSSLADALAARKNKRVVSVGIVDPQNPTNVDVGAMKQLATTGSYVEIGTDQLDRGEVTTITKAMATLGRSIYTANYCTPKRAGTDHTLLFTLKGNESTTTTTCTPATFPSTQPTQCAKLDPSYTMACGAVKGTSTYFCCPATAPYTCPGAGNSCYRTASEAAAKCGSSTSTNGCVMCGGSGTGPTQDTGLLAGTAIRVRFNATSYKDGQCQIFWGPTCKALNTCCQQLSSPQSTTCTSQLWAAVNKESACATASSQYCGSGDAGSDAGTDARSDARDAPPSWDGSFPPPGWDGALPPPPFSR